MGCYCGEDQGAGYTYEDEHGPCEVCRLEIVDNCKIENPPTDHTVVNGCHWCIARDLCTRR